MKILLLGAATAAMALTGFAASAQPYNGRYGGGYSSRGQDQYRGSREQRGDYNRGDQGRSWNGDRYAQSNRWNQDRGYSGYARRDSYDRNDDSNGVTTALAGGLIGLVLGSVLSSHSDYGQPAPYAYSQPSYGYQSYGYQPYGY